MLSGGGGAGVGLEPELGTAGGFWQNLEPVEGALEAEEADVAEDAAVAGGVEGNGLGASVAREVFP